MCRYKLLGAGDGGVEVVVDHTLVKLRSEVYLIGRAADAGGDAVGIVGAALLEAAAELLDAGRSDEYGAGGIAVDFLYIERAAHVYIKYHIVSVPEHTVYLAAQCAVISAGVHFLPLDKLTRIDRIAKLLGRQEMIVHAIFLAGAWIAVGG